MQKSYAIVGLGKRAHNFVEVLLDKYSNSCKVAAICDSDLNVVNAFNQKYVETRSLAPIPGYHSIDFNKMIVNEKIDTVIVCTTDSSHHIYINQSVLLGRNVITEKPMAVSIEACQQIIDTQKMTKKDIIVTFPYRFIGYNTDVKRLLKQNIIGSVYSINLEYSIDTISSKKYFSGWYQNKQNSGGIVVHNASHFFDLVNWWLDIHPISVFASGNVVPELIERNIISNVSKRQGSSGNIVEHEISLISTYTKGVTLNFHLTTFAPFKGYRAVFTGTKGMLELNVVDIPYTTEGDNERLDSESKILIRPTIGKPYYLPIKNDNSNHGDIFLFDALFKVGNQQDDLRRLADHVDGAYASILGIAANISFETKKQIDIGSLLAI